MRWEDYFIRRNDDYDKFWRDYLTEEKRLLFILGNGFDPRMCFGLESIVKHAGRAMVDCILVDFASKEQYAPDLQLYLDQNNLKLDSIMRGKGMISKRTITTRSNSGHSIGPRNAAKMFTDYSDFNGYTDIVVDISSLPMSIYFLLIGKILSILDSQARGSVARIPNLHVVVTESVPIDKCIGKYGISDEANYLYGFTGDIDLKSEAGKPLVWIPILGENQKDQIVRISDHVLPREICPILPSPSTDPRRGDNIVLEYQDLLYRLQIEKGNIIYGSEQNPFEVYRQIHKTIKYYQHALSPLGGPRFAISPLSSKLMSLGAFLVAYEEGLSNSKKVGITYVESAGYEMNDYHEDLLRSCERFSMWISGDCYDPN